MSISINTSEYTQTKKIVIDGEELRIRPMSSAETLTLSSFGGEMQELQEAGDTKGIAKLLNSLADMYFGLYNKPEIARKLLLPLSYNDWFDIYNKVFEVKKDA